MNALGVDRRRRILGLALPIIGGMVSQNVLNLVDAAMVGTLGNAALAGVGLGGFLNFLLSAMILGLSAGVQAMASRRVGEGRDSETALPLNGGLLLALVIATPWSILLAWLAPHYFGLLASDSAVVAEGVPYLQARLLAMVALGMNFSFRGYWNAVDKSILYMSTLIVMHAMNIFLNWVFIFGNLGAPELGSVGAGIASAISTAFGTLCYFYLGFVHARSAGFLAGLPTRQTLVTTMRLSVPAGMQQFFFAAGMTVFLAIVARIGTPELAATKVIVDLLLVGILPGLGFGLAAASLVGQALGRGQPDDARQWGWDVVKMAVVVVGSLGIPALLIPEVLLSPFLRDPETLRLAAGPLRLVGGMLAFDSVGLVLMNALMGAGDMKRVMYVSTAFQWLFFLPAAYVVGPMLGWGLLAVFVCQLIYRTMQAGVFAAMWRSNGWQNIAIT